MEDSQEQSVQIIDPPQGGTFTLSCGRYKSKVFDWNADPEEVQRAAIDLYRKSSRRSTWQHLYIFFQSLRRRLSS